MTEATVRQAADLNARLTSDVEPLQTDAALAMWRAECTGEDEAFRQVESLNQRIMTRLSDREDFATAESLLAAGEALDDRSRRELTKWRNQLAQHQIDAATIAELAREEAGLGQVYNSFRAVLEGRPVADNEIDRILLESCDSAEVEAAWRASKKIADATSDDDPRRVADRLRDLVRLRNRAAGQIGYPNSYRASLELGEIEQEWLYETLDLLEARTRPPFRRWKADLEQRLAAAFGVETAELRPWHYRDRFFQAPPPPAGGDEVDTLLRRKEAEDIVAMTVRSFDELGF
ncbi:MAG: hypothetical protein R3190_12480, partial [Thermoanaerobaculia bacterium]|nr:hypothetical protein [Thermoanaerobaculia bacterium]